jgi:hypothetical protein
LKGGGGVNLIHRYGIAITLVNEMAHVISNIVFNRLIRRFESPHAATDAYP